MDSKQVYSREELLLCSKGELFGNNSLKLPLPQMLMLDRITEINANKGNFNRGYAIAELDIHPELWFFNCHFEGDPVMPGSLGMDGLSQLVGFYLGWKGFKGKGRALGVSKIKFKGEVLPDSKKITYKIDVKKILNGSMVVAIADGSIGINGQIVCISKNIQVGVF
jgi:3-hydroxyacyl-[acyl-carrier protein] dehydratase / trans-2-decenoyl-[acyl-carrier protein] isomerase